MGMVDKGPFISALTFTDKDEIIWSYEDRDEGCEVTVNGVPVKFRCGPLSDGRTLILLKHPGKARRDVSPARQTEAEKDV